jgi:hypothetical protein
MDSSNLFLELKGQTPLVFSVESAKELSQQLRNHCEELERRPKPRLS